VSLCVRGVCVFVCSCVCVFADENFGIYLEVDAGCLTLIKSFKGAQISSCLRVSLPARLGCVVDARVACHVFALAYVCVCVYGCVCVCVRVCARA